MKRTDIPVVIGVAQLVEHESDPRIAMTPLEMLVRIGREASEDAGGGKRLINQIDTIGLVTVAGWYPRNAAALLGEKLGVRPATTITTEPGGETPLVLVNHVAAQIASGRTRVALVAGAHNLKTLKRAVKENVQPHWGEGGTGVPQVIGSKKPSVCDREKNHGLHLPIHFYPVFENALRARRGLDIKFHNIRIGNLMHRFSQVAAKNPYAWFPVERGVEELITPTPVNRMICFPYTKYLNAVLDTNQAAGIFMVSDRVADELGIAEEKRLYWRGGANTREDPWFVSERPDLSISPSLCRCARETFLRTGISIQDMDFIDFYSCFPVAVEMAAEAYGVTEDDPRGLTVTGGLPYAGGPGSNYTLHSLAAMVNRLRARPGSTGLVTGNGMFLSSHSSVVISTIFGEPPGAKTIAASSDGGSKSPPAIAEEADGRGIVETYTVVYDRSGVPETGIVIGRLEDGRRFVANTPSDRELLEAFVKVEEVGRSGSVKHVNGRNIFEPK